MKRSTPDDEAFKARVIGEFTQARDRARAKGMSTDQFAQSLGITRAALHKQMTGKTIPSLRVLEKARKYWGVRLSYGELDQSYVKPKKKDPKQMELQLSFEDISKEQIEIKRFSPKGEFAVELLIRIDFSKSA